MCPVEPISSAFNIPRQLFHFVIRFAAMLIGMRIATKHDLVIVTNPTPATHVNIDNTDLPSLDIKDNSGKSGIRWRLATKATDPAAQISD